MTAATQSSYAIGRSVPLPYEQAVARIRETLQQQGFGVLTEIDVQATLKKKLDVDFKKYVILGACNPPLAYQGFQAEPDIGLLLPCNVVVREENDGKVIVSFMDPVAVLELVGNPGIDAVAREVRQRLERVRDSLAA